MNYFDPNNPSRKRAVRQLNPDMDTLREIRDEAFKIIMDRMHPSYGPYLIDHSLQVGLQTKKVLKALGFDENVIEVAVLLAELHDIGKAHNSQIEHWIYTVEKPDKTARSEFDKEEKKKIQSQHRLTGPKVLAEAMENLGIDRKELDYATRLALRCAEQVMIRHHDFSSPAMNQRILLDVIRTIDLVAGQLKTTNHDYKTAFDKIYTNPEKFKGQYNPAILHKFAVLTGVVPSHEAEPGLAMQDVS